MEIPLQQTTEALWEGGRRRSYFLYFLFAPLPHSFTSLHIVLPLFCPLSKIGKAISYKICIEQQSGFPIEERCTIPTFFCKVKGWGGQNGVQEQRKKVVSGKW